ncbi:MAG: type IV pilus modification protein PilV [Pseudomonadota bacterium]|nr:type IV pilus modification protein PilV [Pseudomonadota bacterium]
MKIFTPNKRNGVSSTQGFTLVEVLVSLVILAIGLLGIAKLMMFSSHANDSAYLRSQATALAYEILDNMRANRQEALPPNQSYDTAAATPVVFPYAGVACVGTACNSPTQVAQYDLFQWGLRLDANSGLVPAGALPNGKGSVVTAVDPLSLQTTVTIVVSWDDSVAQATLNAGAPAASNTQQITLETIL